MNRRECLKLVFQAEVDTYERQYGSAIGKLLYFKPHAERLNIPSRNPYTWFRALLLFAECSFYQNRYVVGVSYLQQAELQRSRVWWLRPREKALLTYLSGWRDVHEKNGGDVGFEQLKKSLSISIRAFDLDSPEVRNLREDIINLVRKRLGSLKIDELQDFYETKLAEKYGTTSLELIDEKEKIANIKLDQKDYLDAEQRFTEVIHLLERVRPIQFERIATIHSKLGWLYFEKKLFDKALETLSEGLKAATRVGTYSVIRARLLSDLSGAQARVGEAPMQYIPQLEEAIRIYSSTSGHWPAIVRLFLRLSEAHQHLGDFVQRKSYLEKAREIIISQRLNDSEALSLIDKRLGALEKRVEVLPPGNPQPTREGQDRYESARDARSVNSRVHKQKVLPFKPRPVSTPSPKAIVEEKPLVSSQDDPVEEILNEMDQLVGLTGLKENIQQIVNHRRYIFLQARKGNHLPSLRPPHTALLGNPGTGKTTVARLLGRIYYILGYTESPEVIEVGRSELIGQYIGESEKKTEEILSKAKGKTLFIDEAYALARSDSPRDFGHQVIDLIVKTLSDDTTPIVMIFAGYPKEMKDFLNRNPGLSSRISNHFNLPDYAPNELLLILQRLLVNRGLTISHDAYKELLRFIGEVHRSRNQEFGNARFIHTFASDIEKSLALRLINAAVQTESNQPLDETITVDDITKITRQTKVIPTQYQIDTVIMKEVEEQLENMIGLKSVKEEVSELINLVRFAREEGKDVLGLVSMNCVFLGNPGTGKTTIARLISMAFKGLGLLEKGHLVEAHRPDFISEYRGGTTNKAEKKFQEAMGGTLFIDEAYGLVQESRDSVGYEAVDTLVKLIEDHRGKVFVILAGYPKEMEEFLETNPGLRSRFDRRLVFEDYSTDELYEIFVSMIRAAELEIAEGVREKALEYISGLPTELGNARLVRKFAEGTIRQQHLRLAKIPKDERTRELLRMVLVCDIERFVEREGEVRASVKKIGFR